MADQTIDYGALAEQARGTTPAAGIDYSALASQARGEEQEPIGYRNGMPVYSIDVYGRAGPPPQPPVFQGMDAEGKPVIASPPGPPPSPIPYGITSRISSLDPRTGEFIQAPKLGDVPLLDAPVSGYRTAAGGVEKIRTAPTTRGFEPWLRQTAGGISDIVRGTLEAATPLLPAAIMAAPVATLATLASGTGLSAGTEAVLNYAGLPKEYSALISDLTGLYGAHRTLKFMGKIANLPYMREGEALKARLEEAVRQAQDPNATPMEQAAARARAEALIDGIRQTEAGSPGGYFLPQVSIGRTPGKPYVKNQLNPIEQASQDYLREQGIDTPLSMQTGSPQAADLEGAVRRSTGGGFAAAQGKRTLGQVQELGPREFANIGPEVTPEEAGAAVRGKLAGDLEQTRKALVDQVAPVATTPELAGAKVLEKGKATIRQFHQAAKEAYDAAWVAERDPRNIRQVPTYDKNGREIVDEEGSPVTEKMALPVDVTDVAEKLKPIADRYERTLSDTDAHASLGLKTMRNFIKDAVQYPKRPLSAVEMDLGMLKDAARTENLPELRDESQGLAAASVKALQAKIDATMAQAKYPGWDGTGTSPALRHLQSGRLNTAKKYEVEDIYKPFGRNIEQVEPVAAFKRATWSGDAGIEHLRKVATIAPEHMPEIGRAFIDSGGKWGMLGPETKKILFKNPELIKNLDEYFARQEKFGSLTEMGPVDLFDKLTSPRGKPNELLADVKEHAPEQMPGLLRAFVGELWNRSTREGNIQKVQSTLDKWLQMDPKSKALMADNPQIVRNLDNLFFSLKRLNKEVNPSGSGYIVALNAMKSKLLSGAGITAGSLLGYSHGGTGEAGAGVGLGIMAGVGAEALLNKAMARILFDQRSTKLLTQGIKFQLKGNDEGARLIGESLSRMLSGEQPPPEGQPPSGGGPPPSPSPRPEGGETPGITNRLKEITRRFWEEEEGSLKLPRRKQEPTELAPELPERNLRPEDDYTKHMPPPEGERMSPYKSLRPLEIRTGGKLGGSLHDLRRAAERDPGIGAPDNERTVLRDKDGEFVVGRITPQDWINRVEKHLSADDMVNARKWYSELYDFFNEHFGEKEGPKMALAWLSSQQNASPSDGMMNVLRAMDQLRGMPKDKVAGLAEAKILAALKGEIPEGGYAAKLNDFVDSAMGKTTRTWMGDDPRGGQPAVIDVWANRDVGKIDQKVMNYLIDRFGERAVKKLRMDGKSIGETDYDYGAKVYNGLVDHLNKIGYDGGGWTGDQVQAVGWTAMQKAMGDVPEFASDLISKNTRRYGWEVQPGEGSPILKQYPWHTLSPEQQKSVTEYVGTRVTDLAAELTGAKITNREITRGAYLGQPTISVQMDVFASPETFRDFGRAAGYLGQQSEVWHVRPLKTGNSWAYSIRGDKLNTPELQQQFWEKLRDRVGVNLVPGYSPMGGDAGQGIFIVNPFNRKYLFERAKAGFKSDTSMRYWTAKDKAKIDAGINAVEKEMGLDLEIGYDKVDLGASLHNWANTRKKTNGHLQRLMETGRSDLANRLSNHAPESLQSWWKEAWDKYAGSGAGGESPPPRSK